MRANLRRGAEDESIKMDVRGVGDDVRWCVAWKHNPHGAWLWTGMRCTGIAAMKESMTPEERARKLLERDDHGHECPDAHMKEMWVCEGCFADAISQEIREAVSEVFALFGPEPDKLKVTYGWQGNGANEKFELLRRSIGVKGGKE